MASKLVATSSGASRTPDERREHRVVGAKDLALVGDAAQSAERGAGTRST
jgi:hypothetical protein